MADGCWGRGSDKPLDAVPEDINSLVWQGGDVLPNQIEGNGGRLDWALALDSGNGSAPGVLYDGKDATRR